MRLCVVRNIGVSDGGGEMRKVLEFCGSPELLIALLYSDDVCQTIKSQVMASGKVSMFVFAEDDDLHRFGDATTEAVDSAAFERPQYTVDDLRYGEKVENLDTQFDGADEMMGQGVVKMRLRETLSHDWMEGDDSEVVGT